MRLMDDSFGDNCIFCGYLLDFTRIEREGDLPGILVYDFGATF